MRVQQFSDEILDGTGECVLHSVLQVRQSIKVNPYINQIEGYRQRCGMENSLSLFFTDLRRKLQREEQSWANGAHVRAGQRHDADCAAHCALC